MKKIDGYKNQNLKYYNKMQDFFSRILSYLQRVSSESLDSSLRCSIGDDASKRYLQALCSLDHRLNPSIFDRDFFQQFHQSGLMTLTVVAFSPKQFTCKYRIFSLVDSSCVHLLERIYGMIEMPLKRGLVPAGVRLPYGYITTPPVTSSVNAIWADTFPLCDGNCRRNPCKSHPASTQRYLEIGQVMWGRFFDTVSSRFFFMFCADFVGFVAQVYANPAILADCPFSSLRNPGNQFEMVIPFLPVEIVNASFMKMNSLMKYFEEFKREDGKSFLLPKTLTFIFKEPMHFEGQELKKRIIDLGRSGGFLRKLCDNFFKRSPTSQSNKFCRLILTRVLNRPDRAKMHYFVRKTIEFCDSLIRIGHQLNDGAIISLLEESKRMLQAI